MGIRRGVGVLITAGLVTLVFWAPGRLVGQGGILREINRVSVSSEGVEGNANSRGPRISGDGRYVAFSSRADNLVDGDQNGVSDVFVHDRQTGITELISVAMDGRPGNSNGSYEPDISGDGRYVVFVSWASNLVAEEVGERSVHVFVRDRTTGETELVSQYNSDNLLLRSGDNPAISSDGRYVSFISRNLLLAVEGVGVEGMWDLNQIFVYDRTNGAIQMVSVSSEGEAGNQGSHFSALSENGRYVAFDSDADNLVDGDQNGERDVFVHDRQTGETERVSISSNGAEGNLHSGWNLSVSSVDISSDGRYVAFISFATNLVDGDQNRIADIFVRDRVAGETERVSVSHNGEEEILSSGGEAGAISGNGRYVVFESYADDLVEGDDNEEMSDIFVHDRTTRITEKISVSRVGVGGNNHSYNPSISANGGYIAFTSHADNLVEGDNNARSDVFVESPVLFQLEREELLDDGWYGLPAEEGIGCQESDNGNDPYQFGVTILAGQGEDERPFAIPLPLTDRCCGKLHFLEYFCRDGGFGIQWYQCDACRAGQCLRLGPGRAIPIPNNRAPRDCNRAP